MPETTKQAIYLSVLAVAIVALLVSFYVVQSKRPAVTRTGADFETIRARLLDAEDNINTQLVQHLVARAQTANIDGKLDQEGVDELDAAVAAATSDSLITDKELITIGDQIARTAFDTRVGSRDDVRTLLSR